MALGMRRGTDGLERRRLRVFFKLKPHPAPPSMIDARSGGISLSPAFPSRLSALHALVRSLRADVNTQRAVTRVTKECRTTLYTS